MKASILRRNGDVTIGEISNPLIRDDECLLTIRAVGVCSSDIARAFFGGAYNYPLVMGHEISGTVIECGHSIDAYTVGDRVCVFPLLPCMRCEACQRQMYAQCVDYDYYGSRRNGGYAELLSVKEWNLLGIPEEVSYKDAALLEPTAVVFHAIEKLNFRDENEELLIIGSGFLGLMALDLLKLNSHKLDVIVVDRNENKLLIARNKGANTILLDSAEVWSEFIVEYSGRFKHVLEATGSPDLVSNSIALSAPSGTLVLMGNPTDDVVLERQVISSILRKELTIVGTWNSIYKGPNDTDDWLRSMELMVNGYKPSDLVDQYIELCDLSDELHRMHLHKTRVSQYESVKAMVLMDG